MVQTSTQPEQPMQVERKETEVLEDVKKKSDPTGLPFYKLLKYADTLDWILMALGTIGSVVHGMAQPVGYLLLGKALNAFGSRIEDKDGMVHALKKVVPYVWYMAIATFPAGILEIGCWMYASERQTAWIRLEFLRSVLRQEIGAFANELSSGKVIAGISTHMSVIQDATGEKLGHFLSYFATFFSGVLIAFICSWEVSLVTLFVVPLILLVGATYTKKMNAISAAKMIYLSEATTVVEKTISHIKTVFAFVGEDLAIKSFSDCTDKQSVISRGEALIKGDGTGMFQAVTNSRRSSGGNVIAAVVVTAGRSSGGHVIAAVMSILFGAISITYAAPDMQVFNQAKAAGNEVFKVIRRQPTISNASGGIVLKEIEGNIDIRNIHFSYPSREDKVILQGFTLSIPAGKTVALVGSSGCGKSTVISLVARFYDPSKGVILIDNHNIRDLDLKCLRQNNGAVSQEPSLFAGTIKDNLKVGNLDADDQQIENAAMMANAHNFISQLPDKYSTEVGQRGFQLSGGQKQRIAIARAVLKNPPILLLDEATSALDSQSEKLVQKALEKAMQGRTVILIAHRLSTIVNADEIAVVENGQVKETGTHSTLLDTSKFYNSLFNMQNIRVVRDKRGLSEKGAEIEESLREDPEQEEHEKRLEAVHFFRIWFGLRRMELLKTAIGSIAAGLSGISKPVFGFFIIKIGVAYYHKHAKREVGWYSIAFSLIGLLSLVSHILQHYYFGVVGEKAMTNLRKALFSGSCHSSTV
ncbi:hypothetical protein EUGRSUZ_K00534 [Eucalyptus grandis]|uniref:Uncharacterized protein n=2 Tax=Eucalyptus grandis TaxID=71139 RepID=A0ACC3IQV5_EUCGR|nr:hypothetical protein EUGRSUZ_K00534 [Eucalyptus grandis]